MHPVEASRSRNGGVVCVNAGNDVSDWKCTSLPYGCDVNRFPVDTVKWPRSTDMLITLAHTLSFGEGLSPRE